MTNKQKFLISVILLFTFYFLLIIYRYWYADTLYAKAKNLNRSEDPIPAGKLLSKAISISPNEPYFHLELSESYTKLGKVDPAISEMQKATTLSPSNVNLKRAEFSMFIRLSLIDTKYLKNAIVSLEEAIQMAPTDAKLLYNLGLSYERVGESKKAIEIMQNAIEMKPNYKEARLALAFLLIDKNEKEKAKEELNYILTKIDPNDTLTQKTLKEIE